MLAYIESAALGYIIGNIQFAVIFSYLLHRDDVRHHGSGNAGSTNMLRVYGKKDGIITFAGDLLKGVAGVLIGRLLGGENCAYMGAVGVILGHCYPVFFGFHGGKGVASSLGAVFALNPLYGGIVSIVAAIVAIATKTISAASLSGTAAYLIIALIWGTKGNKLFAAALFILICIRHRENIARMIAGSEGRVLEKFKKEKKPEGFDFTENEIRIRCI